MPTPFEIAQEVKDRIKYDLDTIQRIDDRTTCLHRAMNELEECLPPAFEAVLKRLGDVEEIVKKVPDRPTLKVWNDGGTVRLSRKVLQGRDKDFSIVNKAGYVDFDDNKATTSSGLGFPSGFFKLVMWGGLAYWYREELRIVGRGILAGANLAVERWREKQREKAKALDVFRVGAISEGEECASCKAEYGEE